MTEPFSTSIMAKHGAIAMFGGIVHSLSSYRKGETKGLADIAILSIISAFTGVIFALLTLHLYADTYLTYAIAGTGGFIGVEGMSWVTEIVKSRLDKTLK